MKDLKVFRSKEFGEIRVVEIEKEPWFVGKDIAENLGYSNTRKAIIDHVDNEDKKDGVTIRDSIGREQTPTVAVSRLDKDEVTKFNLGGLSGMANVVNEYGLYNLILASRKPNARRFKRWVTHEVLPSIRKHGAYMSSEVIEKTLSDPDYLIRLATTLKEEREKRILAEAIVEEQKPKALFADAVAASKSSILFGDLTKILKQNGYDTGQKRLFEDLRQKGYLIKRGVSRNMPTQMAMKRKLFEVKESVFANSDGSIRITKTTKVTGKGQQYFVNLFLGQKELTRV